MSTLRTDRGNAKTAIPVRSEASAVRFSARRTWISPKMTLSSVGSPFVSIRTSFQSNRFGTKLAGENRVEPLESPASLRPDDFGRYFADRSHLLRLLNDPLSLLHVGRH